MQTLTKRTLSIFWEHSKKYRLQAAVLVLGVFLFTVFQTYTPFLYRDLINLLASGRVPENLEKAIYLVVLIFILNFVKISSWRVTNFVNNYFESKVMRDLTNTCYQYLQKHSVGFFSSSFVGSLVTKVKRYERAFEQIADQLIFDLGRSLLDTGLVLTVLLWKYPTFGLILLFWCAAFLVFAYFYARFKLPYDIRRARVDTHTTAQLADSFTNNTNIKLFASYERENERFGEVTNEQFLARKKSWDLGTWSDVVQGFFMVGLEFLIMYVAVKFWLAGKLDVGSVALLQAYVIRLSDKLWNTGKNIRVIYEALADANEMTQMLSTPFEIKDATGAGRLEVSKGSIGFRNVLFGYYKEASILKDFNFSILPGERVALIGPSGGGKSTIVKLLLRFYDIQGGEILIDGQNIASVTQDSLRQTASLVPQEPILFHRTLMDNIRYAKPDASDEEVIRVSKLAHAHEFISSFSRGYNSLVGERGIKLSGGERQRVAIARAILKNAPILILDEATSSLDSESEMYIQDALRHLMQNRTTIVIAHRLSTIMQMDRIVVVENGVIVEEGKHEELLKVQQGLYQKLWGIQAGGFTSA
ncbi:MAG: ABC transporter ATP-binding protein [bacterium]|nr:ABC transporter ATP-binding protein [bacterium]